MGNSAFRYDSCPVTLDDLTVARIEKASARLGKPKNAVVRDAVAQFYERISRLRENEKAAMLRAIDEMLSTRPTRSRQEVDRELRAIRRARKNWGRRTQPR
jgi:hypothetical protein